MAVLVDEGEKGKLALNHFCRQAILPGTKRGKKNYFSNFNLRQHVATVVNVNGDAAMRGVDR